MESLPKLLFFIILSVNVELNMAEDGLMTILEDRLQSKLSECTNYVAKWLEDFNDRHLGNSEIGKMLRYDVFKPKFRITTPEGKGMKKMSMALIPLIFHIGAISTWMILTGIMATKSVIIGLLLLVFKIAVSSAKVASFFTALKVKHSDRQQDWTWTPSHGHARSLTRLGSYGQAAWDSYSPSGRDAMGGSYKTIPTHDNIMMMKKGPLALR